jgi:multicomponent Na+:H+ antiporter subunit A
MATPDDLSAGGRSAERLSRAAAIAPAALVVVGAALFAATLAVHLRGGGELSLDWAPSLGLRVDLELDGLAALYALLATGIGTLIGAYSAGYLPRHLGHHGRSAAEAPAFYGAIGLFMVSMVGLAASQDLILAFLFWDLTTLCSYLLIGYDRHESASRYAALMALLTTGGSALLLLVAALVLGLDAGSFAIDEAIAGAGDGTATLAAVLVAVAALAKSAQVPLHFWLPRAMAAPTPVSAYLHSAALVAAGVLLLGKLHPLLVRGDVLWLLVAVGAASALTGAVLAFAATELKQLLAYSTISQYGYVTLLLGLGGPYGALGASLWMFAHALAKSALFMAAGAVLEATGGEQRLDRLGGLRRQMPVVAGATALAAASLAGLPLTAGFFKDELLFAAALEEGTWAAVAAAAGAALTLGYAARFWLLTFGGDRRLDVERLPSTMVVPVVVLAVAGVVFGLVDAPMERLSAAAAGATLQAPVDKTVAYHLDLRAENLLALGAYALGALLALGRSRVTALARRVAAVGARVGPERMYAVSLRSLNVLSDRIHDIEVRDLRVRVAAVLVPAGALVAAGIAVTPKAGAYDVGTFAASDLPLAGAAVLVAGTAIAATYPRQHLPLVLVASAAGLSLTATYAVFGGPDVALIAALVELVFALVFVAVFRAIPRRDLLAAAKKAPRHQRRDVGVGVVAGLLTFGVTWATLSSPAPQRRAVDEIEARVDDAHAKDTVTAILADFRGLDTMVEITVIGVAFLGIVTYLRRRTR